MNIFKTFKLKWWQGSLLKLSMLAAGIAIGATWPEIFFGWTVTLWLIAIVAAVYITIIWWKQ
ncbi:hypothetical protein HY065_00465 [Candidatus Berkelbacteria bacterium]|nr:hypothetical protein [Candidatus Berkelbacteria bacterium]